jgi:hypothetical protein
MSQSQHLRRDCNTLQLTSHLGSIIYLMRNSSSRSERQPTLATLFLSYEAMQMKMAHK